MLKVDSATSLFSYKVRSRLLAVSSVPDIRHPKSDLAGQVHIEAAIHSSSSTMNSTFIDITSAQQDYGGYYGYTPTLSISIVILVLFCVSTLIHTGQLIYRRTWWMLAMVIGGVIEIAGWISRVCSSSDPSSLSPFLAQQVTLIIAPVFYSAVVYVILGYIIYKCGEQYSRVRSRYYGIIFLVCDVASLVVQAVGGAKAAGGAADKDIEVSNSGANIMMGGIVFQLFSMTLFVILAVEYSLRAYYDKPLKSKVSDVKMDAKKNTVDSSAVKKLLAAMVVGTVTLYIRELSEGWTGPIITTEVYFIIFDGVMMLICMGIFNILYPTWAFRREKEEVKKVDLVPTA
ncbi:hypothetical protein PROFUN_00148 [Planoprotostelium fungivorum]|uniref:Uncharacterized protein n=1 Tax=Planoprotostelium fungivorum TaxID=1890364 RepID=A0A2P6P0S9_9EUKA|nr:hypothetical protein PROFUN_00148 [Planoprotostelium fungivorum]